MMKCRKFILHTVLVMDYQRDMSYRIGGVLLCPKIIVQKLLQRYITLLSSTRWIDMEFNYCNTKRNAC